MEGQMASLRADNKRLESSMEGKSSDCFFTLYDVGGLWVFGCGDDFDRNLCCFLVWRHRTPNIHAKYHRRASSNALWVIDAHCDALVLEAEKRVSTRVSNGVWVGTRGMRFAMFCARS